MGNKGAFLRWKCFAPYDDSSVTKDTKRKEKDEYMNGASSQPADIKKANSHLRSLAMRVQSFAHVSHPTVRAMAYANPMLGMMGM